MMGRGHLDFNRVAMFVQIAEAGGVTAAAKKANLPKSSVSRALSQLETELGVELIVRGSRTFRLTDAGHTFFEASKAGIAAVENARDDISGSEATLRGVVRVAALPSHARWLVAPAVARFVREQPHVEVLVSATGNPVEALRSGSDVAIHSGRLADSAFRARRIGVADLGVFASAAYLRERGSPRHPRELARHEVILHGTSTAKNWELTGPSGVAAVTPITSRIHVDDLMTAVEIASGSAGITLLPIHMGKQAGHDLVRVLPDFSVKGEPLQMLYAARNLPRRVSLFCETLFTQMSACPGEMKPAVRATGT